MGTTQHLNRCFIARLLSCLGISVLGVSCMSSSLPLTDAPVAHTEEHASIFSSDTHDFGVLHAGQKASHVFRLKNERAVSITIAKIRPSCACTVPHVSRMEVSPGGSSDVEVTFTAPKATANVHKTVAIEFSDLQVPSRHFAIKAVVVEQLAVIPDVVMFGTSTPGQVSSAEFVVGNYSDADLQTIGAIGFPGEVEVTFEAISQNVAMPGSPRQIWKAQARIKTTLLKFGSIELRGNVQGATADGKQLNSPVSLRLHLQPRFVLVPDRITIPDATPGERFPVRVVLRSLIDDLPDPSAIAMSFSSHAAETETERGIGDAPEISLETRWERLSSRSCVLKGFVQIPQRCKPGRHSGEISLNCKADHCPFNAKILVETRVKASKD